MHLFQHALNGQRLSQIGWWHFAGIAAVNEGYDFLFQWLGLRDRKKDRFAA